VSKSSSVSCADRLQLRKLASTDIAQAWSLSREMGWNQVASDWQIFLDLGRAYGLFTEMGRLVATCCILPYGRRFAWISMLIVSAHWRRRGLGTRLIRHCCSVVRERDLVPALDATDAGYRLYQRLGFSERWRFQRYEATGHVQTSAQTTNDVMLRQMSPKDLESVAAMDAAAFGAYRVALLERLRERVPEACLVAERAGVLRGFILARDGCRATQVGPLMADSADVACRLIDRALSVVRGPVYIDVPDAQQTLVRALCDRGLRAQRSFIRMTLDRAASHGDPSLMFVVAGPELG